MDWVDAPIQSYVLAFAHTQLLVIQKRLLLHRARQRMGREMGVLVVISSRVYFLLEKIKIKTKITLLSFIAFKVAFFFFSYKLV